MRCADNGIRVQIIQVGGIDVYNIAHHGFCVGEVVAMGLNRIAFDAPGIGDVGGIHRQGCHRFEVCLIFEVTRSSDGQVVFCPEFIPCCIGVVALQVDKTIISGGDLAVSDNRVGCDGQVLITVDLSTSIGEVACGSKSGVATAKQSISDLSVGVIYIVGGQVDVAVST